MIRWRAGGIEQGPKGDLTITICLRIMTTGNVDKTLCTDLWVQILYALKPDEDSLMLLRTCGLFNRAWRGYAR